MPGSHPARSHLGVMQLDHTKPAAHVSIQVKANELGDGDRLGHEKKEATADSARPEVHLRRKIIAFDELANGQNLVLIEFENRLYQLRRTKSGRLVLNK